MTCFKISFFLINGLGFKKHFTLPPGQSLRSVMHPLFPGIDFPGIDFSGIDWDSIEWENVLLDIGFEYYQSSSVPLLVSGLQLVQCLDLVVIYHCCKHFGAKTRYLGQILDLIRLPTLLICPVSSIHLHLVLNLFLTGWLS